MQFCARVFPAKKNIINQQTLVQKTPAPISVNKCSMFGSMVMYIERYYDISYLFISIHIYHSLCRLSSSPQNVSIVPTFATCEFIRRVRSASHFLLEG